MFLALRAEVEEALSTAFASLDWPVDDLGLEEPPAGVDAVLASSAAFRLAEVVGVSPPAVARRIADAVEVEELTYVDAVRAEGPYVNVDPSAAYFSETLATAQDDEYGRLPDRGVSVIVEHTSANPTGPIHVGRARNPIVGDAIARVLDLAGYDVERHYYVNDAGRQIAVFTWAVERFDESDLPEPERDRADYDLVRYYRRGNDFLEGADPDAVEEAEAAIGDIMQGLEAGDEATFERVSAVVDRVLDGMRESLSRLPAEFDRFVKETRFIRDGSTADVVQRLKAMHEADLDDGAWKLDLSADGIEKKLVFVRSDGTSLYPTRDLAHHEWKLDRADQAVTVLGEDHKLQADQLTATLDRLGHDVSRLRQVFHSWVTLPEGGMSTRAGTGIDLDDLLDEAIERARAEVESRLETRTRDDDLGAADIDRIARQVGVGAVRYDIVAKQPTKGIAFDWEEALDFEAQSAPYVQYVHARCCGILDEAAGRPDVEVPAADDVVGGDVDPGVLERPEERDLLRVIARFPAVVEAAASDLEPHAVASYTRTLAEAFNAFYRECPVLDAEDEATREARLALTVAARHSVANALGALGVAAPESM